MTHYGNIASPRTTPQTEPASPDQVQNNAGGFVFGVGPWKQLDRFLILGQVGPTYYATERKVVKDCLGALQKCLAEDGPRVVHRIVEISDSGRAPKNDPAIFALAVAAGAKDPLTRHLALEALPKVCRIGTHLFHFAQDVGEFRRWGRGLRTAIAKWYTQRSPESLAMQAVKYQQRDGWSHRDLLRLSHPKATTPEMQATFRWIVGGKDAFGEDALGLMGVNALPALIQGFIEVQAATDAKEVVRLIEKYNLPREALPTQFLNAPEVWAALLPNMGITALVRNLGKMTAIGLLKPMGETTKMVVAKLTDEGAIKRGRIHPMAFLLAQGIYRQGRGDKGKLSWSAVREIGEALDAGFYAAFETIEPTDKNTLIALDVSCSMDCGIVGGAPGITPRIAAAAMAMVTARSAKNWAMVGFSHHLVPIGINSGDSLETVAAKMRAIPMGGTDCSLPMLYAAGSDVEVDVFQVYTDNETWAGKTHPHQALRAYRAKMGRQAKLAVVGLTATNFTIADPEDSGMLDVVGMDSHAPAIMADFAREGI